MKQDFDYLSFILRGQPFHYGHAKVIETALQRSKHVILFVGSANRARCWFNPFIFKERAGVISEWAKDHVSDYADRITILPLDDYLYDIDSWLVAVQHKVETVVRTREKGWSDYPPKIGLIGHSKDHTSFYLNLFPQWGSVNVEAFTDRRLFNSTDIRDVFFKDPADTSYTEWGSVLEGIPDATMAFLEKFHKTEHYGHLCEYHAYIRQYKEDHKFRNPNIPYDAIHTCVDACVVQSGHILLVKRKDHPGKGLWALPGGFINPNELLVDAMLRELWEETKLKVTPRVLRGSLTDSHVFDDPHRSARGRILSHTYRMDLEPMGKLPRVKGGSDAKKAEWVPLSELRSEMFFEDHYFIIQSMSKRARRSYV
jgi:bifunctional NMN adenylyltransferase/nudix hydrolase